MAQNQKQKQSKQIAQTGGGGEDEQYADHVSTHMQTEINLR
jgi:hypothetical protein